MGKMSRAILLGGGFCSRLQDRCHGLGDCSARLRANPVLLKMLRVCTVGSGDSLVVYVRLDCSGILFSRVVLVAMIFLTA
jgi:hypothetical protein